MQFSWLSENEFFKESVFFWYSMFDRIEEVSFIRGHASFNCFEQINFKVLTLIHSNSNLKKGALLFTDYINVLKWFYFINIVQIISFVTISIHNFWPKNALPLISLTSSFQKLFHLICSSNLINIFHTNSMLNLSNIWLFCILIIIIFTCLFRMGKFNSIPINYTCNLNFMLIYIYVQVGFMF